jgi:hypothetical protein
MDRRTIKTITSGIFMLVAVLGAVWQMQAQDTKAQDVKTPYPSMAPLDDYLMTDRNAEIALARSAAPKSVSDDASVMVLTRQGYETAVEGKNGFVCIVGRLWTAEFDHPEFWNPKGRGPVCYNPAAVRSVLPYAFYRTKLALEGLTKPQMLARVKAAVANKELRPPEPGAMSYMLSKEGHLNDAVGHWHPHLMFHLPKTDPATWGANLDGSPVTLAPLSLHPEPETLFNVVVGQWSDGTPAPPM